jgi:hypothetical protein
MTDVSTADLMDMQDGMTDCDRTFDVLISGSRKKNKVRR